MIGQSVDACFTRSGDMRPAFRGREMDGSPHGCKKIMAKFIVIEAAVHVSAKDVA